MVCISVEERDNICSLSVGFNLPLIAVLFPPFLCCGSVAVLLPYVDELIVRVAVCLFRQQNLGSALNTVPHDVICFVLDNIRGVFHLFAIQETLQHSNAICVRMIRPIASNITKPGARVTKH